MGASLSSCSAAARRILAEADRATGLPLTTVCFDGPPDRLTDTAFAQPGVVAVSLAAAEALAERLSEMGVKVMPDYCAGHSVGELAALAAAGAITYGDCLKLVAERGRLMVDACAAADGSMAAVMGMDELPLVEACLRASDETGASVQVGNLNSPGQIVLSGNRRALARACELAREMGARRIVDLDVAGPFHSVYMQPAADAFQSAVREASISRPAAPIVLNVNARPCDDPERIRRELVLQATSPVRWSDSVKTMWNLGCTIFVELGPGQVLSGMVKRIARDATVLNVEDDKSLRATAERLHRLLESSLAPTLSEREGSRPPFSPEMA